MNQREINADTESFATALKYVLRQDPDVILLGEMRDLETIAAALTIAETGHLVFATLHTNSAFEAVNRIVDSSPRPARSSPSSPSSWKAGRSSSSPASAAGDGPSLQEMLVCTPAVKAVIREGKTHQLYT